MAYSDGGQIDANDFNEKFAGLPLPLTDVAKQFNAIWGVGKGNSGYGQPNVIPTVAPGQVIRSNEWELLKFYMSRVGNWQGNKLSNWPGEPIPVTASSSVGSPVLYDQGSFQKVLDYYQKYRMSCYFNGGGALGGGTNAFSWIKTLTFTVRFGWPSGDTLRYFFNCGGQISMNFSYPTTSTQQVPQILKTLATDMGTIYWTCLAGSEKTNINGVKYDRVTKIGGGGNDPAVKADVDYYSESLYDAPDNGVLLFQQLPKTTVPGYSSSVTASIYASTTGTRGLNDDNGRTITLRLVIDLGPTGISGYTMPANMGTFTAYAIQPYLPLTGWSGPNGNLLYSQPWSIPWSTTTIAAI